MQLLPGDPLKKTLLERGLQWDMFLQGEILGVIPNLPNYPSQIIVKMKVNDKFYAVPCEKVENGWRMITAYESRKIRKEFNL